MTELTLWQVVASGGTVMVLIFLFSIASVALIVRNFIVLNVDKNIPLELVDQINDKTESEEYEEALKFCNENPLYITNILRAGLEQHNAPYVVLKETLQGAGVQESAKLRTGIVYLSMIGVLAPMLGLLGTVLGMMQSFNVIAFQEGLGKPELLAGGIAKALVTTAAGLIVAIPSMGFYYYFRARIQKITLIGQKIASDMLLKLSTKR